MQATKPRTGPADITRNTTAFSLGTDESILSSSSRRSSLAAPVAADLTVADPAANSVRFIRTTNFRRRTSPSEPRTT
ncbi:hypothetical protein ASE14_08615 [Agromyces sp. Root81]|nr:hypothetical protein ASE14_08615 [Agromyces sp. Root81]